MKKTEIYVSMGSSNIVLSVVGNGLVLREASLVAVDIESEKVIEWGDKAKKMLGKVRQGVDVFSPISRGTIKHKKYASILLKKALNKVFGDNVPPKSSINFIVKVGLYKEEYELFKQIANENDIGEVNFSYKPVMALKGAGVNTSNSSAYLSVVIGGGITNIAIIGHDKILDGVSISIGGKDFDEAICEYLINNYNLEVSPSLAEKIKTYCGSLILQDTSNMEVLGIDSITKEPKREFISAKDVRASVIHFFDFIFDQIQNLINNSSPDVVADVIPNGIYLSGGTTALGGLKEYIYEKLNIVSHIVDNPENTPYLV